MPFISPALTTLLVCLSHVIVRVSCSDEDSDGDFYRRPSNDIFDNSNRLFKYFLLWGLVSGLSLTCGMLLLLLLYYAISPSSRPWRQAELREQLMEAQIRYLHSASRTYAASMAIPRC